MANKRVEWLSRHRKPTVESNPQYPDGMDIDMGNRPACKVEFPYPAECVGLWFIECHDCKSTAIITAAGRQDDPKSYMLPCRQPGDLFGS
jgi:hypothetical protein